MTNGTISMDRINNATKGYDASKNPNKTFVELPSGEYGVKVTKVEHKRFNSGSDSIRTHCTVLEGEHQGEREFIDVYLDDAFLNGKDWLFIKNVRLLLNLTSAIGLELENSDIAQGELNAVRLIDQHLKDSTGTSESVPFTLQINRKETKSGSEYTDYVCKATVGESGTAHVKEDDEGANQEDLDPNNPFL